MIYKRQPGTSDTPQMLSLKDLKDRDWTEALVKQFLGVPDAFKPNPYYRKAAPMQLYSPARIEQAESQAEWQQAKARATLRSQASKMVAARKATELVKRAQQMRITVNYIRHQLTSYDTHLEQVPGQIGVRQAGKVIRRRIYDEIASEYPEYARECQRQMQARYGEPPEKQNERGTEVQSGQTDVVR